MDAPKRIHRFNDMLKSENTQSENEDCRVEQKPVNSTQLQLPGIFLDASFLAMLYRKSTLAVLLALIFLSFFGTLTVSAWMFPQNYDWRYRVISNLLSPRDNPDHYCVAASGLTLTALLMLPFAGYLQRQLGVIAPRMAAVAAGAFTTGIIALICASFVVPQHTHDMFGFRRVHEFLGRSAAGFLAFGMLSSCWCAWKGRERSSFAAGLCWVWFVVTLLPLSGVFVSECLLILTRLEPSWATPVRGLLRHSVFWHLGFWEWTGAAAVFAFLSAAVFLMPSSEESQSETESAVLGSSPLTSFTLQESADKT